MDAGGLDQADLGAASLNGSAVVRLKGGYGAARAAASATRLAW